MHSHTTAQIYRFKYDKARDDTMASHFMKYAIMGMSLQPITAESEFVESVVASFPVYIQLY